MFKSLEAYLAAFVLWSGALLLLLFEVSFSLLDKMPYFFVALIIVLASAGFFAYHGIHSLIVVPLRALSLQLESIATEEYNHSPTQVFSRGVMQDVFRDAKALADDLQQRKTQYSEIILTTYKLIENIESPVFIISENNSLSYANNAASKFIGHPWWSLKNREIQNIGIRYEQSKWLINDEALSAKWQIRSGKLANDALYNQILIFTDVEDVVKKTRQLSWQQIIRVLSHEIKNSLTPIGSIAQTLKMNPEFSERSQQALEVISKRTKNLNDFVNRYSEVYRPLTLKKATFSATELADKLRSMFSSHALVFNGENAVLFADQALMEQVLINLVKNSADASEEQSKIKVTFSRTAYQQNIRIQDEGCGLGNPQNLFTPFYTTKPEGQGIGLGLARHIIEQHNGNISLQNRTDGSQGAVCHISLPYDTGTTY